MELTMKERKAVTKEVTKSIRGQERRKTGVCFFLEIDLVGHECGDARGEFIQSLCSVDICTGWTEIDAVKNKVSLKEEVRSSQRPICHRKGNLWYAFV